MPLRHLRHSRARLLLLLLVCGAGLAVVAAPASAVITPTRDALVVAKALADRPSDVVGASFVAIPPTGNPAAVSTTPLGEFPTSGTSYAVLSTGNTALIAGKNDAPDTGADDGGAVFRGARDVTILKVDLHVPDGVSCLSIRFRFYSEEFPEWVGTSYNDAFIAELDSSTWDASGTASPTISAPANFAFDTKGNPISVNSLAETAVVPERAAGTTFDAATYRLRASTPITPGQHSLYLSIFDQGDRAFDSAVFIDRLTLSNLTPCVAGAAADLSKGLPPGAIALTSGRTSIPVSSVFLPERLVIGHVSSTPNPLRTRGPVTLRVRVTDTRGFLVRGAKVLVLGIPPGWLSPVAETETGQNGVAKFTLRPTALLPIERGILTLFIRASKVGEPVSKGVSTRRLVALRIRPGG